MTSTVDFASDEASVTPAAASTKRKKPKKALPAHARTVNRALILQMLFHEGEQSRADLSRSTGLTRVTISDVIGDLIDEGLVRETGIVAASGPGKPGRLVDIDREGHRIIGIDLSEPGRFRGAVMTLGGAITDYREVPFHEVGSGEHATEAVTELVSNLLELTADHTLLGIGVGSPGLVDSEGVVFSAPNLGWQRHALEAMLADAFKVPVSVVNDANAAVLAERIFGGAHGDTFLVMIGRGVGGALLADGKIHTGSSFAAGEIGHVVVGTDVGPLCRCGNHGCLEAWVAEPYLRPKLAEASDDAARETIIADAAERLGIALAPLVATLDLAEIIVTGPRDIVSERFCITVYETLRARTLPNATDRLIVRMSENNDLVLTGAAVTVLMNELGVA